MQLAKATPLRCLKLCQTRSGVELYDVKNRRSCRKIGCLAETDKDGNGNSGGELKHIYAVKT